MRSALNQINTPLCGRKQTFFPYTTVRYQCYQFVVSCLRSLFDEIHDHLVKNNLLTRNQSRFRPGDSTVNQLLSITYCIYTAFEESQSRKMHAVFLDISKSFGTMVCSLSLNVMVYRVPSSSWFVLISLIAFKE